MTLVWPPQPSPRRDLGSQDLDIIASRNRRRNLCSRFGQVIKVEFDRFLDKLFDLLLGFADGDPAGKVGTYAPQLSSPFSITTMYRITISLIQPV